MCFIYTDGNVYLGMTKNNFIPVKNIDEATKYTDKKRAANIFVSSVPKILRRSYNWALEEFEDSTENEKINTSYTPVDLDELKTNLNDLASKFSTLKGNKEWLQNQHSEIDREISDILHFIENEKFSACEGFKLCKALKELRVKRREVKNELQLINIIDSHTCNHVTNGNTSKAINDIENRQYRPRILSELFENRSTNEILKKTS